MRWPQRMPRASTGTMSQSSAGAAACARGDRAASRCARARLPSRRAPRHRHERHPRRRRPHARGSRAPRQRRACRRELPHDEVGRRPAQAQRGESLAHLVAGAQRRGLLADDAAVHGLGEGDELDLAVQGDEREPVLAGSATRRPPARSGSARRARARDRTSPASTRPAMKSPQLGGLGRPPGAGREQQLAAVEQPRDTRTVGDVHPAHPRVERRAARRAPRARPVATASSARISRTVGSPSSLAPAEAAASGRSVRIASSSRRSAIRIASLPLSYWGNASLDDIGQSVRSTASDPGIRHRTHQGAP